MKRLLLALIVVASCACPAAGAEMGSPKPQAHDGTIVWKAGAPGLLGRWIVANTNQCGTPVNTGTVFTFNLVKNGESCTRNQANPISCESCGVFFLQDGNIYTWTFEYVDGTSRDAAPGMADTDARALIWQLNPYATGRHCMDLHLDNGGNIGTAPQWVFVGNCDGTIWRTAAYVPQETDEWKIQVYVKADASGWSKLWRNGALVTTIDGPTYSSGSSGNPWWNFGPYKYMWKSNGYGGDRSEVNATFSNMTLYCQHLDGTNC